MKVCLICEIPHFEDCGTCYGFGVYIFPENLVDIVPVAASAAHSGKYTDQVFACRECGSNEFGIMSKFVDPETLGLCKGCSGVPCLPCRPC